MAKKKTTQVKRKKISLETREQIQKLMLMNNAFMNLALENNIPCVEEMLHVILGKSDLTVKKVQTQRMFQGFSRSIYLDVFAEDSKEVLYNIEIQQDDEGADPRRTRFHTGMIDVHSLKAGQDFKELPEVYVIFITLNDTLKLNQTIYTIHKYVDRSMKPFNDGSHLIYINGSAEDDGTEIWKLVHDLRSTKADEMYFPRLAARVKFLKEDEEGIMTVSNYFEEREAKAVKEAEKRAANREKESLVLNLINMGKMSLEDIAKCSGLTLKKVQTLASML